MINLFKFPFKTKNSNKATDSSLDMAAGIMRNYVSVNKDLTAEQLDRAWEEILIEVEKLQENLSESNEQDQYELIRAALENIDNKLKHS